MVWICFDFRYSNLKIRGHRTLLPIFRSNAPSWFGQPGELAGPLAGPRERARRPSSDRNRLFTEFADHGGDPEFLIIVAQIINELPVLFAQLPFDPFFLRISLGEVRAPFIQLLKETSSSTSYCFPPKSMIGIPIPPL